MSARERTPKDDVWDALAASFGEPRTKTERTCFGRVVAELLEAGASAAEVDAACVYVHRAFDSPSVFSVPKWFTVAQRDTGKLSVQQQAIQQLRSVK